MTLTTTFTTYMGVDTSIAHRLAHLDTGTGESSLAALNVLPDGMQPECDVQFVRDPDGPWVGYIFHDIGTERVGGSAGVRFDSLTPAQASAIVHQGEPLMTLSAFLARAATESWYINVELKGAWDAGQAEVLVSALEAAGLTERCTVMSFTIFACARVMSLNPDLRTMLHENPRTLEVHQATIDSVQAAGPRTSWSPNMSSILGADGPALIQYAAARGVDIYPYTVNTQADYDTLRARGITKIITNYQLDGAAR